MRRGAGKQSPYPRRGTPAGDQVVGECQAMGCSKTLHRGDHFVVLLGDVLVCRACHENPAAKFHGQPMNLQVSARQVHFADPGEGATAG